MTFANTPQGLEKDPTKSSDACLQQKSVEHFTICNGWLVLLISVFCAAMSVPYLFFTIEILSSDPWEDLAITLVSVVALLIVFGLTGVPGIIYFILALVIWTIPHKLIVDGQGWSVASVFRKLRKQISANQIRPSGKSLLNQLSAF